MNEVKFFVAIIICLQVLHQGQSGITTGKGKTEDKLLLLDNYIPAAMQVVFYLTDHMKYEIRPIAQGPSTTTVRPTQPHRPGNYAPERPPGAAAYYSQSSPVSPWRTSSEKSPGLRAPGYPRIPGEGLGLNEDDFASQIFRDALSDDLALLGAGPSELLHQINSLGDFDTVGDVDDDDVFRFSINYDDAPNLELLRQRRVPPTRAYVTLLSLYDWLNKEAKEKGLNKYNGYNDRILNELSKTSQGSAEDQLKFVLSKVLEARNTRKANIVKKIKALLEDLDKPDSYINDALKYVSPLQFSL